MKHQNSCVETFIRSRHAVHYVFSWDDEPLFIPVLVNKTAYHYLKKRGMVIGCDEERERVAKALGCRGWGRRYFVNLSGYRWWEILNMLSEERAC